MVELSPIWTNRDDRCVLIGNSVDTIAIDVGHILFCKTWNGHGFLFSYFSSLYRIFSKNLEEKERDWDKSLTSQLFLVVKQDAVVDGKPTTLLISSAFCTQLCPGEIKGRRNRILWLPRFLSHSLNITFTDYASDFFSAVSWTADANHCWSWLLWVVSHLDVDNNPVMSSVWSWMVRRVGGPHFRIVSDR